MSWKIEYVILILLTTIISYISAIFISRSNSLVSRKLYLLASVLVSLGVLVYFKYFNFILENVHLFLNSIGYQSILLKNNYLLPVGISFYTFQTLSYTIDVYKGEKKVEKHFGIYALYVSFFPQLVAGPIERSTALLPQFKKKGIISSEKIITGIKYIILGYLMKLVVADRLGLYVDSVYNNVPNHDGLSFILATVLFSFQIYGDFAGYSFIAVGIAKILGYDLMINFRRPYFAMSITEFWRRWHISLSTWFRDYLYIPLGGNKVSHFRWIVNILLTFVISGIWHGAAWSFIIWGAIHGTFIIIEKELNIHKRVTKNKFVLSLRVFIVFSIVTFAWIFFRANSILDAVSIITDIFAVPGTLFISYEVFFYGFIGVFLLLSHDFAEEYIFDDKLMMKYQGILSATYFAFLFFMILFIGVFTGGQFIYFQF